MTTDAELIDLIQSLAGPTFAARQAAQHGIHQEPSYWEIAAPLREAMDAHPEFSGSPSAFFLGKQIGFFNQHQSINILMIASQVGAREALAWYRRVRETKRAQMRLVGELHGIAPPKATTLSNGVQLVPLADLPTSPQTESLKASTRIGPAMYMPAGVVLDIGEVEASDDHDASHRRFLDYIQVVKRTVAALTLHDNAAPTLGSVWLQFCDHNLQAAELGVMWMTSRQDGRHNDHPSSVDGAMLEWVERYLALPACATEAIDFSISRLNLARRRVTARDQAVDVCVAMESLLSGKGRGELTHRLAVRTALLLGTDLVARTAIVAEVRKLYDLRSKLVHGGDSPGFGDDPKERTIAHRGLELCLAALRAVVRSGQKPEPDEWELTGGPPFNRYSETEPPRRAESLPG